MPSYNVYGPQHRVYSRPLSKGGQIAAGISSAINQFAQERRDELMDKRLRAAEAARKDYEYMLSNYEFFTNKQIMEAADKLVREHNIPVTPPEPTLLNAARYEQEQERAMAKEEAARKVETHKSQLGYIAAQTERLEAEAEETRRGKPEKTEEAITYEKWQRLVSSRARQIVLEKTGKDVSDEELIRAILMEKTPGGLAPEEWKNAYTEAAKLVAQEFAPVVAIPESWIYVYGKPEEAPEEPKGKPKPASLYDDTVDMLKDY